MHLKSLTVKGFKSFAEPTTLQFEPGVTCVVGPNGSGKSNVVDALSWVMGEQGAKSLRGGSMEDVIFAGTQSRGPLGRAEVSLTIDNADGALPIDYSEVTISRTLFRNGASEYAINREPCRLLDVQELLSDSGLGREMHVIVGQGQLDSVLHASADDRRRFIEEAAGITKHRRRKEKTVRKLEAMDQNLTRLQDLVGEIRRQLKPLGRQAEVAREAQTIQSVVRDATARLLADDLHTLNQELGDYQAREGNTASERQVVQDELDRVSSDREAAEAKLTDQSASALRQRDYEIRRITERVQALHALAAERLTLLSEESSIALTATVSEADIEAASTAVDQAAEALSAGETALGERAAQTATARAQLDALEQQIAEIRDAIDANRQAEQARQEAIAVAQSRQQSAAADRDQAAEALSQADARIAELERTWHDQTDGISDVDAEKLQKAESALQDAWTAEAAATEQLDEVRSELHRLEREKDALAATVQTLSLAVEAAQSEAEYSTSDGVTGRVADVLSITAGYETAIATALGSLADALVVSSRDAAWSLSEQVSGTADSRLSMLVDEDRNSEETLELEGLTPATDVTQAPAGVQRILRRVFIAPSLQEVKTHWVGHPDLPDDVTIVTRAGDLFHAGRVVAGSGSARSSVEMRAERDGAQAELARVSTDVERVSAALEVAQRAHEAAAVSARDALSALRDAEAERSAASEALSGVQASLDAARSERERANARLERATQAEKEALTALAEAEAVPEDAAVVPDEVPEEDRTAAKDALEQAQAEEVDQRVRVEQLRRDHADALARVESLRREQAAAEEEAKREQERQLRRRQLVDNARAVSALTPALLSVAERSAEESALAVAAAEAERQKAESAVGSLRSRETELRERVGQMTDTVHSIEMHIYERNLQRGQLVTRAQEELGLLEEVLLSEYGPDQPVPGEADETVEFVRADQEKRLAQATKQLDQLGRVNPLALEEFEALEQRHQFLVEQLEDVQSSKKDLLAIVDDIDNTMRDVFLEAFEDTAAAFDDVFPVLFPGGTGSLSLTDPESPLTTGVEVAVRPRGKKIERLSLLSGGERSLAAVALLIAIFIARPSPFYILDEVEAALDDANLGRLIDVMERLRKDSQLIVITHQKRTMEIADALYGVSMRDDGVSAVVGQRVRDEIRQAS